MTSFDQTAYAEQITHQGVAICQDVLSAADVDEFVNAISAIPASDAVRQKKSVYGVRNLLETSPAICRLAIRPEVWQFVTPILGENAFAFRAIFFNKTPDANWVLGWHQDRVISVAEKIESPGFLAWGNKAGVWQVQPPTEISTNRLALRIHLDECGPDNGPLRVLPGSHRHGLVEDEIDAWKRIITELICTVQRGGIVAMHPLILHASSKAVSPLNRRVIHIEYAAQDLPNGLRWSRQIRPS